MSRLTFGTHPYLLGFDQLDRLLERTAKAGADAYPPYNIELADENAWRITIAVAGFSETDLSVTLEDRQLVVRGQRPEQEEERMFLHRGIAARAFQRAFVLAEGVEVAAATLEDGLLRIDLRRSAPDPVVRTITIARA